MTEKEMLDMFIEWLRLKGEIFTALREHGQGSEELRSLLAEHDAVNSFFTKQGKMVALVNGSWTIVDL